VLLQQHALDEIISAEEHEAPHTDPHHPRLHTTEENSPHSTFCFTLYDDEIDVYDDE
jgi:hypothetical protein